MPYTHWAYFKLESDALDCAVYLTSNFDALCAVDPVDPVDADSPWRLLAARNVDLGTDWHAEIEEVVRQFDGKYDGGEATYSKFTGRPIRAADS